MITSIEMYSQSVIHTVHKDRQNRPRRIRKGQAKAAKLLATMTIDKALNCRFHLLNPYTANEASLYFDTRVRPPEPFLLDNGELSRLMDN